MIHQGFFFFFFFFEWEERQQPQKSRLMQEESAVLISFILGSCTHCRFLVKDSKFPEKKTDQYLVSESHEWSIGQRSKYLLVGPLISVSNGETQQQNCSRPPFRHVHWCSPIRKQRIMVNKSSQALRKVQFLLAKTIHQVCSN